MVVIIVVENNRFIKIPNNFFYNNGEILSNIGGKNSFVLYCLLTIRKNINNNIHLSIREMNDFIFLDKNTSRGCKKVRKSLKLLKSAGFIDFFDSDLSKDIVKIRWINLFPNKDDSGWIKFKYNDFDIFEIVGVDIYCVMWLLRMHINYKTKTSFLSISHMRDILKCQTISIQRSIELLEYSGLFKVERGGYHESKTNEFGNRIKKNNTYRYAYDTKWLLKLNTFIK